MKSLAFLSIWILSVCFRCDGQFIDRIGGSVGIRFSDMTINPKNTITEKTDGYSSHYCFDLNLKKKVFSEQTYFNSGINFSREQIGYYPLIKLNEIPNFKNQYGDTISVGEFRMWNYQIGIPLKLELNVYRGWMDYFPLLFLPAVRINCGIINNFVLSDVYKEVILLQNNGGKNTIKFYEESTNNRVSEYYLKTISRFNMIGQIGIDLYTPLEDFEFGFNIAMNRYFISPLSQGIDINSNTSMDFKLFFIAKLNCKNE